MSCPLCIEFPQAVYHVMNRGAGRREMFLGKEGNENFLETLAETHALWRVDVFAYCLISRQRSISIC